jgi:hypothetical protein
MAIDSQNNQDIGVFVFGVRHDANRTTSLGSTGYGFFANVDRPRSRTMSPAAAGRASSAATHRAQARRSGTESFDSLFGIFIRGAQGVRLSGVDSRQLPGHARPRRRTWPAGNVDAHASRSATTRKACPEDDEEKRTPPLSGLVSPSRGHTVSPTGNTISDNAPTGRRSSLRVLPSDRRQARCRRTSRFTGTR